MTGWKTWGALFLSAAVLLWVGTGLALDPAPKCESDKNKTAGKYAACLQKAEAIAIKKRLAPDYSKCDSKFSTKWVRAEERAGAGVCPTEGDETVMKDFITAHCDAVATALEGGGLPSNVDMCNSELNTCENDLGSCHTDLTSTQGLLTTCNGDLNTCQGSLATCNTELTNTQGLLTTCNEDLAQLLEGDLGTCQGSLATCNTDLTNTQGLLTTCNGEITQCESDLADCQAESCGNGEIDPNEDCELGTLEGATCEGLGRGPGNLGCTPGTCVFDTSGCRFADNGDGTITDSQAGLMWEKKDDNNAGGTHDKDDTTYSWSSTGVSPNGTAFTVFLDRLNNYCDDDEATPCVTDADCADPNNDIYASNDLCGHAGYRDWRLPEVNKNAGAEELDSLIDLSEATPKIYSMFKVPCTAGCTVTTCSCTVSAYYWSFTTYTSQLYAWSVDSNAGSVNYRLKTLNQHVRAVRGL